MATGPTGARCQEWPCRLIAGSKLLLCSALLCSAEKVPQKQDRNCHTVINIWSWAPDGAWHQDILTDWPSVAMWLWLWLAAIRLKIRTVSFWPGEDQEFLPGEGEPADSAELRPRDYEEIRLRDKRNLTQKSRGMRRQRTQAGELSRCNCTCKHSTQ
jgi:hypothetical protein